MNGLSKGFGLIEIMLAMTLGLVITAGLVQLFLSVKNTYVSQNASATMQEDARFVLSKIAREIRMVGMFGCLATVEDSSKNGNFTAARNTPIRWDSDKQKLTLITADVGTSGSPTWVILSDCESSATAYAGETAPRPAVGQLKFPISKVVYGYNRRNQEITLNLQGSDQGLISNVSTFSVLFGVASAPSDTAVSRYTAHPANPALIRSVRLSLTLTDPSNRVKDRTFTVVAALRNRLG